jgi:MATE family multidrug resistance protein
MVIFHLIMCFILIAKSGLGVIGAALATSISFFFAFVLMSITTYAQKDLRPGFFLPTWDSFKNAFGYLKIAVPPAMLMCFDVWIFEIITILSA